MANRKKAVRIFVSHGHNQTLKLKLRQFIKERLDLVPVILAEQPDDGLTIIEKLEKYGRTCDFALILLTADDETASGGVRARQNVIHELGVFHGILGSSCPEIGISPGGSEALKSKANICGPRDGSAGR